MQNSKPLANRIDPDAWERRDQRIGNWIVALGYGGGGLLIIGALIAIAKLPSAPRGLRSADALASRFRLNLLLLLDFGPLRQPYPICCHVGQCIS